MSNGSNHLPKLLSQRTAQKLLEEHGWSEQHGGKPVVKMVKLGHRPITLPAAPATGPPEGSHEPY